VAQESKKDELSGEWGWRISEFSTWQTPADGQATEPLTWLQGVDLGSFEETLLSGMIGLRKLSEVPYFNASSTADSTIVSAKATKRDAIVATLDNLLVTWTAVSLVHQADVSSAEEGDVSAAERKYQRIVDELVLGHVAGVPAPEAYSETNFAGIGAEWSVTALSCYMQWMSQTPTEVTATAMDTDSQPPLETRSHGVPVTKLATGLLLSILARRPSLTAGAAENQVDFRPLFSLANALLDGPSRKHLALPAEAVRRAYTDIFAELCAYSNALKSADAGSVSGKQAAVYLSSTVMLFAALCELDADGSAFLHKQSTVNFLLQDCLGLVEMVHTTAPTVCNDDSSRLAPLH
jgi:hypothetical protein